MNAVSLPSRKLNFSHKTYVSKAQPEKVTRQQDGNLEHVVGHQISGWVVDSHCSESVSFQIFDGNQLIATDEANLKRPDLVEAGYATGGFGFLIDTPEFLMDGKLHRLALKILDCDTVLSILEVTVPAFARTYIEQIEGGSVTGHIQLSQPHDVDGFDIELLVDGDPLKEAVCTKNDNPAQFVFNIGLPASMFDDNQHVYSVKIKGHLTLAAPYIETLPSILTPWEYISDGASGHRRSAISKIAAYRYAALQKCLEPSHFGVLDVDCLTNIKRAHDVLVEGYTNRTEYKELFLPALDKPDVSIVIPVYDNLALTYHCIASLILANEVATYEVIVVDDKSADKTTQIEDIVKNVVYIRNDVNLGFLMSSKRGAEVARGEYIVFLNNDTEVTQGWLDEMLDVFKCFNKVGAVGSKLIYSNGKLQEAGGIVWSNGKPWNIGNGQNAEHPLYNYTRQVDYLSGAALAVSRTVWDETGGFSEEFAPAYYEDTDLAFKVREAGYRTFYCPSSTVVHFEGMSNGRDTNTGIKRYQSVNAPKFRSKWRHSYRNNGAEGQNFSLMMDRNVDFRALVIDYTTPRPDQDAGGYAAIQEITLLQELGCKVTFIPNNFAHMGKHTEALQRKGVECIHAPFYLDLTDFLQARGYDYDVVYVTRYDIAEQVIGRVRQYSNAKIIFNNADLHFLRELRAALQAGDTSMEAPVQTRERELSVMRQVDAVLSYNETEHSVIASHNLSEENVFKCPWVLHNRRSSVTFKERSGIAFLGGYGHPPNREAVKHFVKNVMPRLRISQPGIEFHIYGSRVTDDVKELACDDVIVKGYVEKLSDVFDTCRVFVAPLLSGAGIKGKVLESIAHGIPTVLSPVAAEATGLTHGHSTFIAESTEQWCDSIINLYRNEESWNRLAENSNALVNNEYSVEKGISRMADVLSYVELDPADTRTMLFNQPSTNVVN